MQVLNLKALDGVDPGETQESQIISAQGLSQASFHATLSGASSVNVTVAFYASNESTDPADFFTVTNGSQTFNADGQKLCLIDTAYRWLKIVSSDGGATSGGALDVWFFGSGQN